MSTDGVSQRGERDSRGRAVADACLDVAAPSLVKPALSRKLAMDVDSPFRIAILGAGPIGLEAALYARHLGYQVALYERDTAAANLFRWGHVRMFSPFRLNASPLGRSAVTAQNPDARLPVDEALLTGAELAERYLLPLTQADLLEGCIRERTEVLSIGRDGLLKGDLLGDPARAEFEFRILLSDSSGAQRVETADVVIDVTGTYGNPNYFGTGGIAAIGETALRQQIEYGLPDVRGRHRKRYAGRHVLVVGAGYSAATNVLALTELARDDPSTRVTWVTRPRRTVASPAVERVKAPAQQDPGPIRRIENDPLPERDCLTREANRLAADRNSPVNWLAETNVHGLERLSAQDRFSVALSGRHAGELCVDRVIANVGFRPQSRIYSELQVHACYATDGPIKLAAALVKQSSDDCLVQQGGGPETLVSPERDFYILGAKSYGRDSRFLISIGLEQVRDVFSLVAGRPELDLYTSVNSH